MMFHLLTLFASWCKNQDFLLGNEIGVFKNTNLLKKSSQVDLQLISTSVLFNGVQYSLDGLKQFSILSKNYHNSEQIDSPLWRKEINGTLLVVVKNEIGKIEHVSVQADGKRADIVALNHGNSTKPNYVNDHLYITISENDYDEEVINQMTKNHKDARKYYTGSSDYKVSPDEQIYKASKNNCSNMRVVDVAIAFDSTLCQSFGNSKEQTERHIQAVIGLASQYYEPICLKLQISYMEGFCNPSDDPYYNMVRSKTILEQFTAMWRSKRESVSRDVAHLLTGNNFEKGVLGKSYWYHCQTKSSCPDDF
jgi:hypothetical protein